MKKVAILTDFVSHDPAYSLCGVVLNQVKMLRQHGYVPKILARGGFSPPEYEGCEIVILEPGEIGNNVVNVTNESAGEIDSLYVQLSRALKDVDIVLTHDMIYQANMWKYHVAAQRLSKNGDLPKWIHWVHSTTPMNTHKQTKQFSPELEGKMLNSRLVVMTPEETIRKAGAFGYEIDEVVYIPNPIDLMEGYHPAAVEALEKVGAYKADVLAVYPARLDRGKQVEVVIEVFEGFKEREIDGRIIVVDFHSTAGDKATYRTHLKKEALERGVPLLFTSDLEYQDADYHIPHKAVLDLFDYADVLIHPSRSECDPLSVPEAMWKGCLLVLNFDLPMFRMYQGKSLLYKFSSNVDVNTGLGGETNTNYSNREIYMQEVAASIAYMMKNNPVLANHIEVRKTRGLEASWNKYYWPAIEGLDGT